MAAEDAEETTTEKMAKAAELLQKIASPMISFIFESIPIVINVAQSSYNFYQRLPTNYIHFLIGTIMCFFGGIYPTVFAAIEVREYELQAVLFFCSAFIQLSDLLYSSLGTQGGRARRPYNC